MKRRFKVTGTFDVGGGQQTATVEVDSAALTIAVRPFRRRRWYGPLPLSTAAAMICRAVIDSELRAKRVAKAAKKRSSS